MKHAHLCLALLLLASQVQAQLKNPQPDIYRIPFDSRLLMLPTDLTLQESKDFVGKLPTSDEDVSPLAIDESLRQKFDIRLSALFGKPAIFEKLKLAEVEFNNTTDRDFIAWRSFGQAARSLPNWFNTQGKLRFRKIALNVFDEKVFFRSSGADFEATGYFPLILNLSYGPPPKIPKASEGFVNPYLIPPLHSIIRDGELHLVLTPSTASGRANVASIFRQCDAIQRADQNLEIQSQLIAELEKLYGPDFTIHQVRKEGPLFKIEGTTNIDDFKEIKPTGEYHVQAVVRDNGKYSFTLYASERALYIRTRFFSDLTLSRFVRSNERFYTQRQQYSMSDELFLTEYVEVN